MEIKTKIRYVSVLVSSRLTQVREKLPERYKATIDGQSQTWSSYNMIQHKVYQKVTPLHVYLIMNCSMTYFYTGMLFGRLNVRSDVSKFWHQYIKLTDRTRGN